MGRDGGRGNNQAGVSLLLLLCISTIASLLASLARFISFQHITIPTLGLGLGDGLPTPRCISDLNEPVVS